MAEGHVWFRCCLASPISTNSQARPTTSQVWSSRRIERPRRSCRPSHSRRLLITLCGVVSVRESRAPCRGRRDYSRSPNESYLGSGIPERRPWTSVLGGPSGPRDAPTRSGLFGRGDRPGSCPGGYSKRISFSILGIARLRGRGNILIDPEKRLGMRSPGSSVKHSVGRCPFFWLRCALWV